MGSVTPESTLCIVHPIPRVFLPDLLCSEATEAAWMRLLAAYRLFILFYFSTRLVLTADELDIVVCCRLDAERAGLVCAGCS